MGKVLPILGIVAAVLSAAFAWAVVGPVVPFIVMGFLFVCAVFLFLEKKMAPVLYGVVLILLAFTTLLYFAPFAGEGGRQYIGNPPDFFKGPYEAALCVVAWAAILVARNEEMEPTWFLAAGPVLAGISILLMLFIPSSQFGNFANSINVVAGVLCLLLAVPMGFLLRGPAPEPALAPSPFQPTRSVPPGLKPAGPAKTIPTVAAPLKKAPAHLPPDAPPKAPVRKSPPK